MFGSRVLAFVAIICFMSSAVMAAPAKGLYEKDSLVEKLNEMNFKTVRRTFPVPLSASPANSHGSAGLAGQHHASDTCCPHATVRVLHIAALLLHLCSKPSTSSSVPWC